MLSLTLWWWWWQRQCVEVADSEFQSLSCLSKRKEGFLLFLEQRRHCAADPPTPSSSPVIKVSQMPWKDRKTFCGSSMLNIFHQWINGSIIPHSLQIEKTWQFYMTSKESPWKKLHFWSYLLELSQFGNRFLMERMVLIVRTLNTLIY